MMAGMKGVKQATKRDYTERMLGVMRYIQGHLDEALSLEELAEEACFSRYHFHRIFKGMLGESVQGYIRRLRLERAAGRLKHGRRTVTDIAFEAGYETHEAFTRAFGERFGEAPREYRRREREASDEKDIVFEDRKADRERLEQQLQEKVIMKVEVVRWEPVTVMYVRHVGPYHECGKAWERLCLWAGPRGLLRPGARFLGLCYDDPEVTEAEKIRYDACITVEDDVEAEGEIGRQVLEGGAYAMTTHCGPYEKLSETYAALCGRWAAQQGYEIASKPSIEEYQNNPEDTEPEDLITDVYVPLEGR